MSKHYIQEYRNFDFKEMISVSQLMQILKEMKIEEKDYPEAIIFIEDYSSGSRSLALDVSRPATPEEIQEMIRFETEKREARRYVEVIRQSALSKLTEEEIEVLGLLESDI